MFKKVATKELQPSQELKETRTPRPLLTLNINSDSHLAQCQPQSAQSHMAALVVQWTICQPCKMASMKHFNYIIRDTWSLQEVTGE